MEVILQVMEEAGVDWALMKDTTDLLDQVMVQEEDPLHQVEIVNCQALVQVQSSPVQVEGLGLSLWSLLPTTTTANFSKCL